MKLERCITAPTRPSSALAANPDGENPRGKTGALRSEGITSFGAILLALLATQHHNLHMLLIAIGIGGAGMGFMTMFPLVRQIMLLMSLAMVGLMLYRACDAKRPASMRMLNTVSVIVTLGLAAWSIAQFGF